MLDFNTLIRDASRVKSVLKELDDGSVTCTEEVKIYIPSNWLDKKLAYIGSDTQVLGIYGIVVNDTYYGVSLINAMVPLDPTYINRIKYNDEEYLEFVFTKGSVVYKSLDLVKVNSLVYPIFDEFFSKGNIPWYTNYEDLGHIFDTAVKHAGANIGENREVTRLIVSILARDVTDRTKYYRTKVNKLTDIKANPPAFVPLKSVEYAATNTMNKIGGNYMSTGIVSALLDKTERVERIEDILTR